MGLLFLRQGFHRGSRLTPRKDMLRFFVPASAVLVFYIPLSCATLPGRNVEAAVYDRQALNLLRGSLLLMGAVSIEYADELAEFSYPLPEILRPLAKRHGYTLSTVPERYGAAEEVFALDVWLREENFSKGFDFRTSITGAFVIRKVKTGAMVFSLSYAEESEETIRSFRHLYRIFEILFIRIAHELENDAAK